MSIKQGYVFEDEFRRSIERLVENGTLEPLDLWYYKMVDTHSFSMLKSLAGMQELTVPKVPADWLIIWQGKPMFVECKMSSNAVSYNTDYVKPHQIENGLKLMAQGVPYYFVINRRDHDDEIKPGQKQQFEVFVVSAQTLHTMIEVLKSQERKSIKWEELQAICDFHITADMRDTRTATWDFSWLFTHGFSFGEARMEGEINTLMEAQRKKKKKDSLVKFA